MVEAIQNIKLAWNQEYIKSTLVALMVILLIVPLIFEITKRLFKVSTLTMKELYLRYFSWIFLILLTVIPLLSGEVYTVLSLMLISVLCLLEYSRATQIIKRLELFLPVLFITIFSYLLALNNWLITFKVLALIIFILNCGLLFRLKLKALPPNQLSFTFLAILLFGVFLPYFAFLSNLHSYIPLMLTVLICVELNDVFAYICGKAFGNKKLCPKISPNKTVAGFIGAVFLTTTLFFILGQSAFATQKIGSSVHLVILGIIISLFGQLGDLMISSIKRKLVIKDFGKALPGHGGFLDRFDSLLLVSPLIFNYLFIFNQNIFINN